MNFPETPGMYVSLDMERPMVYYKYNPQSKDMLITAWLVKSVRILKRMGDYMKHMVTEFEPLTTKDYWIKQVSRIII